MSPKELQYIEDALGHEKQMEDVCRAFSQQLADADLSAFVGDLSVRCGKSFRQLYALLEA